MPTLENHDAIKQYYNEVKDKYPGIDLASFERICKAPFEYIKKCMRLTTLPIIMIKYLGKFKVTSGRMTKLIRSNEIAYKLGDRDEQEYLKVKESRTNYLNLILNYERREGRTD